VHVPGAALTSVAAKHRADLGRGPAALTSVAAAPADLTSVAERPAEQASRRGSAPG